jgi:hypothetical protein
MQDIYLSFTDEAEANSILYIIVPTEYKSSLYPNYKNIDILGIVYEPAPDVITKDYVPIPYPSPNWGVNIRLLDGEDIEPLKPYIIQPKNPVRVWA